ncbi:glycosyltransferase, partial [Helicobacter pylori]
MKFALTGGGTGGHLSIAKALAIELEKQRGY